jgi:hypothetical protein
MTDSSELEVNSLIHGYTISSSQLPSTISGYFLNAYANSAPDSPTFFVVAGNVFGTSLSSYTNIRIGVFFDQTIDLTRYLDNGKSYSCNINPQYCTAYSGTSRKVIQNAASMHYTHSGMVLLEFANLNEEVEWIFPVQTSANQAKFVHLALID